MDFFVRVGVKIMYIILLVFFYLICTRSSPNIMCLILWVLTSPRKIDIIQSSGILFLPSDIYVYGTEHMSLLETPLSIYVYRNSKESHLKIRDLYYYDLEQPGWLWKYGGIIYELCLILLQDMCNPGTWNVHFSDFCFLEALLLQSNCK